MLFELRADNAQTARVVGMTRADLVLFGHVVKFEPAVLAVHDALGAQNVAVVAAVQLVEHVLKSFLAELLRRLLAPGGEDVVGAVMMVMVALALGIVALLAVVVMVVMLVLVVIVVIMVMVVMMPMLVGMLILIVGMMVVMVVLVLIIVVMMSAAALVIMVIMIMVVMMMLVIMWMVMHFRPIPVQIRHIVIMVLMLCIQNHIEIAGIQPRLFHSCNRNFVSRQFQAFQ